MEVRTDDSLGPVVDFVDCSGDRHIVPWGVGAAGLGAIDRHRDPFDPAWFPDEAMMAEAYIAMEIARRSLLLPPIPPILDSPPALKA